jgi:hypothetical protein
LTALHRCGITMESHPRRRDRQPCLSNLLIRHIRLREAVSKASLAMRTWWEGRKGWGNPMKGRAAFVNRSCLSCLVGLQWQRNTSERACTLSSRILVSKSSLKGSTCPPLTQVLESTLSEPFLHIHAMGVYFCDPHQAPTTRGAQALNRVIVPDWSTCCTAL